MNFLKQRDTHCFFPPLTEHFLVLVKLLSSSHSWIFLTHKCGQRFIDPEKNLALMRVARLLRLEKWLEKSGDTSSGHQDDYLRNP